jgi:hypothetical protein
MALLFRISCAGMGAPRRRRTAVAALIVCASACGERDPQPPQPASNTGQPAIVQASPPAEPTATPARERAIVQAPQPATRCIDPEPDSAAAAAAAIAAIPYGGPVQLRVSSFTRHYEGALISVLSVDRGTVGGGGLVWVDRDGCITVLKLHE